ncbi:hypothetical protein [Luteolibacter soli]|uniref:Uncharacterized protein n=1 Tax=Luteolibacter soli TaxID=3135280 RepID=A0ABU9B0B8_9BACT
MKRPLLTAAQAVFLLSTSILTPVSEAGTLYSTQFEEFTVGNNKWGGSNSWVSTNSVNAVQGIAQNAVADLPLGKTAWLGYASPNSATTLVYRPVNFNPVTTGFPEVQFDSLLGVQDSTNSKRDRFYISFYNIAGTFLAAVVFDNTSGKVMTDDGVTVRDTGIAFLRGDQLLGIAALQTLSVSINFTKNVWSAELDSIPLFSQKFTSVSAAMNLGPVAAEWEIAAGSPGQAGDNWLLVADWLVASIPPEPFALESVTKPSSGGSLLRWPAHTGFDYQVQCSDDLKSWSNALTGSRFAANKITASLSFTDTTSPAPAHRYYRVQRTPTP